MITATCRRYEIIGNKFGDMHEIRTWNIEADGDAIIIDGYSMPVKADESRQFVYQLRKTFIRAKGGLDGLVQYIRWEIGRWPEYQNGQGVCQLVNWVTTYGKKKENI